MTIKGGLNLLGLSFFLIIYVYLKGALIMSLSRKERDHLAEVIQRENEMVLKVGRMVRNAFILTLAFAAVTYWGWSGMTDPMFPNIPMSVRNVAKWIALIGLILSGLFTVLGFISHRNGKKSVLKKIDLYEEK